MPKVFKLATEVYKTPAKVWEILATNKGMAYWLSSAASIDGKVGGSVFYRGNYVVGWKEGIDFSSKITAWESEKQFGFEFPIRWPGEDEISGTLLFTLEPLGSHTNLSLSYTFDKDPKSKYLFGDLFAYYLHAIYTTCEHDFHEPALLFDFSRSWKGNIQHVIYINANPDEIFEMLHDPKKMALYFTDVKTFEPEEGGKIDFGWSTGPTKVLEWEDGFELAYDWPVEQDGQKHVGKVKWTLEFEGRQTRVVLKVSGFGADVDHYRTGEALGWAVIMLEIKRIVESGRPALNLSGKIEG